VFERRLKKEDRRRPGVVKRTRRVRGGAVSEEELVVELLVKDVKQGRRGGGIKNIQVEARDTTLFGATKNSAANGYRGSLA